MNAIKGIGKFVLPSVLALILLAVLFNVWLFAKEMKIKPRTMFFSVLFVFSLVFFYMNPGSPFNTAVYMTERDTVFVNENKYKFFEKHSMFEDNWASIAEESSKLEYPKKINSFILRNFSLNNTTNMDFCPILSKLIAQCPEIVSASIDILPANKRIRAKRGPYKGYYRYHLGLKTPPSDAFINIEGDRYVWREGCGILYDQTKKHYMHNDSQEDRIVLSLDIKRSFCSSWLNKWNEINLKAASVF